MEKIAIISDVHGNLEALKETLKDIEKRNVKRIICLGDIIGKGLHPEECVELIREKCEIILRGNCDRHFSDKNHKLDEMSEEKRAGILRNRKLVKEQTREHLFNLPFCHEFYMSGSLIRLFHATPEADNIAIINNDTIFDKYKMFESTEKTISNQVADVVIYGHIHHQYMDKLYNKTLINVGSVGNSFDVIRNKEKDSSIRETTCSHYLIIEGEYGEKEYYEDIAFQFVKVQYDIEKELKDMDTDSGQMYLYEMKNGMYRNMEKINKNFARLGIDANKF